jgi:RNA polymerase I-specific transcription initiation factor RRN11
MARWHDLHGNNSSFLFNSFDWKAPSTARKIHIRRLLDILHLSIQRRDLPRARKAFGLLSRCEEIEWTAIWKLALLLLSDELPTSGNAPRTAKQLDFLRVMMLQHPEEVRMDQSSCFLDVIVRLLQVPD